MIQIIVLSNYQWKIKTLPSGKWSIPEDSEQLPELEFTASRLSRNESRAMMSRALSRNLTRASLKIPSFVGGRSSKTFFVDPPTKPQFDRSPAIVVTQTDKPKQGPTKDDDKVLQSNEQTTISNTNKETASKDAQQNMTSKPPGSPAKTLMVNGGSTTQNGHNNGHLSDDEAHSPSTRRKRPMSANSAKKFVKIKNVADEKIDQNNYFSTID